MAGQILAFMVTATVVTVTPGPDMALVARRAITDGWRASAVTTSVSVRG
jgi:threonine/homoserine/homoserine lactone efflux protein